MTMRMTRRDTLLHMGGGGLVLSGASTVCAAEADATFKWRLPVILHRADEAALGAVALELAELLFSSSGKGYAGTNTENPLCCFWVAIDTWMSGLPTRGYLIRIERERAVLLASDRKSAEEGVRRLKTVSSTDPADGLRLLPVGLLTNYSLIP